MKTIEKGQFNERGTWFQSTRDGQSQIMLSCPGCGTRASLTETHEINEAGNVNPSVECDCGYHEFVTLKDYAQA